MKKGAVYDDEDKHTVRILKLIPERMYKAKLSVKFVLYRNRCPVDYNDFVMDQTSFFIETSNILFKRIEIDGRFQNDVN